MSDGNGTVNGSGRAYNGLKIFLIGVALSSIGNIAMVAYYGGQIVTEVQNLKTQQQSLSERVTRLEHRQWKDTDG